MKRACRWRPSMRAICPTRDLPETSSAVMFTPVIRIDDAQYLVPCKICAAGRGPLGDSAADPVRRRSGVDGSDDVAAHPWRAVPAGETTVETAYVGAVRRGHRHDRRVRPRHHHRAELPPGQRRHADCGALDGWLDYVRNHDARGGTGNARRPADRAGLTEFQIIALR